MNFPFLAVNILMENVVWDYPSFKKYTQLVALKGNSNA